MANDLNLKVGFDIAQFQSELSKTNAILNNWGNQVKSTITTAFSFYAVTSFFKNTVGELAKFEKSMSEVKAITQATGYEFNQLRDNALNLAGAFKAIDISKLETEFGRLGFSTKEILESTKTTINLAAATGEDLGKSAQILGSTLRAMNLDTKESGRVGDVMAAAFNKSALSLNDFGEAMKYVAPVAANAGLSIEQVAAALSVLADSNIRGSSAGTAFRKIITDLGQGAGPVFTKKIEEMAAAGLSGADALDEVGRTAYASLLVLTKHKDKYDEYIKAVSNGNGELQKMSDIMQDNLIGDWNKLGAAWDTIINQKGGGITGFMRELTTQMKNQLIIWNSDQYSVFEKIFGGPEDYAQWVKNMENAKAKATEYAASPFSFYNQTHPTDNGPYVFGQDYKKPPPPELTGHAKVLAENTTKISPWGTNPFGESQNLFGISGMIGTTPLAGITDGLESMTKALDAIAPKITRTKGLFDSFHISGQRLGMAFVSMGSQISSGLALAIQGTIPFAQAMAQMALSVVDSLERIALARIIELSVRDGWNPIVAITGAIVGFAAIKALFGSISSGGGGSAPSGISPSRSIDSSHSMNLNITGQLKASGPDLALTLAKGNYQLSRGG